QVGERDYAVQGEVHLRVLAQAKLTAQAQIQSLPGQLRRRDAHLRAFQRDNQRRLHIDLIALQLQFDAVERQPAAQQIRRRFAALVDRRPRDAQLAVELA